ncbi:MAG: molybdate ABC transporter substrate-binding protein [Magnetovibrio sp.]|nr:molybdate ABC transporter substrate-binding protein [Magnetovibrio sp.]
MFRSLRPTLAIVISFVFLVSPTWASEAVTIYAASSTQAVMDVIAKQLKLDGIDVRMVYGASSTLARQIEHGAPADIYLSANPKWIDYLTEKKLIESRHTYTVAQNTLVVIAGPQPFPAPMMIFGEGYPLGSLLHEEHLALADPNHVPAGIYAKEALTSMKLWDQVQDRIAPARDATGALMQVARGQARLGIVYASDARRSDQVHVFAPIPPSTHSPIHYLVSIIKGKSHPGVLQVLEFMQGPKGQTAFVDAGFREAP